MDKELANSFEMSKRALAGKLGITRQYYDYLFKSELKHKKVTLWRIVEKLFDISYKMYDADVKLAQERQLKRIATLIKLEKCWGLTGEEKEDGRK